MPNYEYKCATCEQTITVNRSIHDDDPGYFCGKCNAKMSQVLAGVGVTFKGGGWGHSNN